MGIKILDTSTAKEIAGFLLEIEAIKLKPSAPFTWSSGWKSPIYCDNRLSLSYTHIRTAIKKYMVAGIKRFFPGVEAIAGVATAGIPQGALVADELQLPYLYVRSKPKGHGMENMIEGKIVPGQKVVLIEDLISTGGSSLKAVEALRAADIEVVGMGAIFTYGFQVSDFNFKNHKVEVFCLSGYDEMLPQALEMGYIEKSQLEVLDSWRKDPANWDRTGPNTLDG